MRSLMPWVLAIYSIHVDDSAGFVHRQLHFRTSSKVLVQPLQMSDTAKYPSHVESVKSFDMSAHVALARPHNGAASVGLVAAGAVLSSTSFHCLLDRKVILTELAAVLIAYGSCILNDW